MIIPELSQHHNGQSPANNKTTRAARDNRRIERLRARRRSREWEVRLTHEFIQTWARILHAQSFLLFTVLEMFADWRKGPNHGHTGGHQSITDLMALTGLDEKTVRRGLAELSFYGLIKFAIDDWKARRKSGAAIDIVVQQDVQPPKVDYRQQFQDVKRLESICRRADTPEKWGEVHSLKWGEVQSPKWGEVQSPKLADTTPQNGERSTLIASNSVPVANIPSSSLRATPQQTTTTDTPKPADQEAEDLFKVLPGYFDLAAAADLLVKCRAMHSDCTLTEILDFVTFKSTLIETGKIKNPVGFLLAAVPQAMRGHALIAYRANIAAIAAQQAAQEREWTRAAAVLSNTLNTNGNGDTPH